MPQFARKQQKNNRKQLAKGIFPARKYNISTLRGGEKMLKRLLIFLLIGLLVFSAAACFGTNEPGEEPGEEPGGEPGEDPGETAFGTNIGGWKHLNSKPGQYFLYEVSSDRTGEGWVSIRVEAGDRADTLSVTCAGDWGLGEFLDTVTLTKGMSGWELAMSLSTIGTNAMLTLLDGDILPLEKALWEEGAEVTVGDYTFSCQGTSEQAGVTGINLVCDTVHSATGKELHYVYRINFDFPLPLFLEAPAANDIWRYTLTAYEGL